MIRASRLAIVACWMLLVSIGSGASPEAAPVRDIYDGEYMAAICSSNAESHRETCRANVITVAHAMAYSRIEGFRACVPAMSVSWGGITDSVMRWLYANQDSWGLSMVGIIAAALSEIYPCPE